VTIDDLLEEALAARDRFWFIQAFQLKERTDSTVTLHFIIGSELFIQVYYSERSGRLSFALIDTTGRIYGRDREYGIWHLHPFSQPQRHESTPEGMSPQPVAQFLAEVEKILVEHDLI
jgi:hypothetical protein